MSFLDLLSGLLVLDGWGLGICSGGHFYCLIIAYTQKRTENEDSARMSLTATLRPAYLRPAPFSTS